MDEVTGSGFEALKNLATIALVMSLVVCAHYAWTQIRPWLLDLQTKKDGMSKMNPTGTIIDKPAVLLENRQPDDQVFKPSEVSQDEAVKTASRHRATSADEASAGQTLTDVPTYDFLTEGLWVKSRVVEAVASVLVYTEQGTEQLKLFWLDGGYFLIKFSAGWLLMTRLDLDDTNVALLMEEREQLLRTKSLGEGKDNIIESFIGSKWKISGVYGQHGKDKFQVTSAVPKWDELAGGLPSWMFEKTPQGSFKSLPYYDLRARWLEGDATNEGRILFSMWCSSSGQANVTFTGRLLTEAEIKGITLL